MYAVINFWKYHLVLRELMVIFKRNFLVALN